MPTHRWKILIAVIASSTLLVATLSCKHESHNAVMGTPHHGSGVVESIDKDLASIQINHEEIKDYMPAMSMPYQVRDASILDSVQPGDRVDFTLETTERGDVVTEIKKVEIKPPARP